jgi:hypothetical protein
MGVSLVVVVLVVVVAGNCCRRNVLGEMRQIQFESITPREQGFFPHGEGESVVSRQQPSPSFAYLTFTQGPDHAKQLLSIARNMEFNR